jgi:hypothetical protein
MRYYGCLHAVTHTMTNNRRMTLSAMALVSPRTDCNSTTVHTGMALVRVKVPVLTVTAVPPNTTRPSERRTVMRTTPPRFDAWCPTSSSLQRSAAWMKTRARQCGRRLRCQNPLHAHKDGNAKDAVCSQHCGSSTTLLTSAVKPAPYFSCTAEQTRAATTATLAAIYNKFHTVVS